MIVTRGSRSVSFVISPPPDSFGSFIGGSRWYPVLKPRPDDGVAAGGGPEHDAGNGRADRVDHVLARRNPAGLAGEGGQHSAADPFPLDPRDQVAAALHGLRPLRGVPHGDGGHAEDAALLLDGPAVGEDAARVALQLQEVEEPEGRTDDHALALELHAERLELRLGSR